MRDASLFRRSDLLAWLVVNRFQRCWCTGPWLESYAAQESRLLNGRQPFH